MANWLVIPAGWLLSVATATGNGFVVFLVTKNRCLHSSANWFVLSLAVADFIVGIAVFPSSYFCNKYFMACNSRVYMAFFWFFLHSSVTNLCVLTWDRYMAIVHPFRYHDSLTKRRPGMVILISWLIPFAIALSLLVGIYATQTKTVLKILRATGVSAFDIICSALLLYAVVRILVVARIKWRQESAIERQVESSSASYRSAGSAVSRRRKKYNAAPLIIALVVFFLICYSVVNYLVMCITFSCLVFDSASAAQILILLLVLNSAVNPLVYAFLKRDIRRQIKLMFNCIEQ